MTPENDNVRAPMSFAIRLNGEDFTTVKDADKNQVSATIGLGAALSAAQLGVTVEITTNSQAFADQVRTKYPEASFPSLTVTVVSVSGPPLET